MLYEMTMSDNASQDFVCRLGKEKYLFKVKLNVRGDFWTVDISTSHAEKIVAGLTLALGVDLLANERFMAGMLFLVDYSGKGEDPSFGNIENYGLIWSDSHE